MHSEQNANHGPLPLSSPQLAERVGARMDCADGPSVQPNSRLGAPSSNSSLDSLNPDQMITFGAKQIISLFVPVTICMFFVVMVACSVQFYAQTDRYLVYTPFHTPNADAGTQTWQTVANTAILMAVIVVMTCVLVLLFKYKCYKLIQAWLVMTTLLLLFLISFIFFSEVIRELDIFVDTITVVLLLWNFGIVGMIVIHWKGPLILQQAYLIFLSAQIALLFLKFLPKWTCWLVLAALAVWDLIAVLCPRGPLRILLEMAHERQQPLFPALLYSTTAAYLMADPDEADDPQEEDQQLHQPPLSADDAQLIIPSIAQQQQQEQEPGSEELSHQTELLQRSDSASINQPLLGGEEALENDGTDRDLFGSAHNGDSPLDNHSLEVELEQSENETNLPEKHGDQNVKEVSSLLRKRSHPNGEHSANQSVEVLSPPPQEVVANIGATHPNSDTNRRLREMQADLRDREERGVKLGLGDFVFYSLLIGRAALDRDPITVATCYVAILVGMCITIIVLGITRRALPALPISIACGILFYFATSIIISPFTEALAAQRLFF